MKDKLATFCLYPWSTLLVYLELQVREQRGEKRQPRGSTWSFEDQTDSTSTLKLKKRKEAISPSVP